MRKYFEYLNVLINNGLKVKSTDQVLVVLPKDAIKRDVIASKIEEMLYAKGVSNVSICSDEDLFKDGFFSSVINYCNKWLMLTSTNNDPKYIELLEDLETYDSNFTYTIGLAPNKDLSLDDIAMYAMIEDSNRNLINWNIIASELNKQGNEIRNRKIGKIKLYDHSFSDLKFETNGYILDKSNHKNMTVIPSYGFVIDTKEDTAEGYIEASEPVMIGNTPINDLSLYFHKGYLGDFDCSYKNASVADKYLGKSCDVTLKGLGFVNPAPFIDAKKGNYILDRQSSTYLLLSSLNRMDKLEKLIYIPIGTGLIRIKGTTMQNNPEYRLFENKELTKELKH